MADSEPEMENKAQVEEQASEQHENVTQQKPSEDWAKKTESEDRNQEEEESVKETGEEITSLDYSSTGARPKDRSVCTRPKTCVGPITFVKDRRQNRRLNTFSTSTIFEEDLVESNYYSESEDIAKLIVPYTDDCSHLLYEKYKKLYQECRQREIDQIRLNQVQIQYEQLSIEYKKVYHARSKLDNLCRVLQNQNKEMKEDNARKLYEEERKRKDLAGKFQESFDELSRMMEKNNIERFKLHEDNVDMTKRIQMLRQDLTNTDAERVTIRREAKLQQQLNESKISKIRLESIIEKQKMEHELRILQLKLTKREEMCQQFEEKVKILEEENRFYGSKIEKYERALRENANESAKLVDNLIGLGAGVPAEAVKSECDYGEAAQAEESEENDVFDKEYEVEKENTIIVDVNEFV